MVKHSVGVVCFNQEEYISECLDALLRQSELPYEIIVLDDSSTDNTWGVVGTYVKRYPDLIKAYQNDQNQGLFENIDKVRSLLTGEVISLLAADDFYARDTIKSVNDQIRASSLTGYTDRYIIVLNSGHLYPDGRITTWNNYKYRSNNLVALRLRFGLSYRAVGLSSALLSSTPSELDILSSEAHSEFGYGADWIKGFEEVIQASEVYFVDILGPIYRLGSGATSKLKRDQSIKSKLALLIDIKERYKEYWTWKDLWYINNSIMLERHRLEQSIWSFFRALFFHSINFWNYNSNYPWYRELKTFVPITLHGYLKYRVYPFLRNNVNNSPG